MKTGTKIFLSITGALLLGFSIGGAIRYFRKNDTQSQKILFVGDSNTVAPFSYADQLKKQFPAIQIKKLAMNGAQTGWMKEQLTRELKNTHYDVVFILAGSNDIYGAGQINGAKNNLDAMYKMAHATGAKVIAVTPPNKNFYTGRTPAKQKLLTELVSWVKANPNKDSVIDFTDITNDKNLFSAGDGYLHPQAFAHKILAQKASQIVNFKNV